MARSIQLTASAAVNPVIPRPSVSKVRDENDRSRHRLERVHTPNRKIGIGLV